MGVEVRPFGVRCNIACSYCYQQPEREAGNIVEEYDLAAIVDALEANGTPFTLFGGEPLLMPLRDLEELWAFGLERFGRNSVQTNGTLVNDRHFELFRRYKVHVGVSCDGPGRCNELRVAGDDAKTRRATARTLETLDRLIDESLSCGLIVTLHRANAVGDRLDELVAWLADLDQRGLRSARLHLLEVDDAEIARDQALTPEENIAALAALLLAARGFENLHLDVADEVSRLLAGSDTGASCVWMACDPYTTRAVQGLEGSGQLSNCGRTNKLGIDFVKADHAGYERYVALYNTPQSEGGCRGCRFFLQCKGQCPGTALGGDWRNRTEHCDVWKHVFAVEETAALARGELPVSLYPQRGVVEQAMVQTWMQGRSVDTRTVLAWLRGLGVDPTTEPPDDVPDPVRSYRLLPEIAPPTRDAGNGMRLVADWEPHRWSRMSWVSDAARAVWELRLLAIREVWSTLEWQSVVAGQRSCAVVVVPDHEIAELGDVVAAHGLVARTIDTGTTRGPEQTLHRWQASGPSRVVQAVIGSIADVVRFEEALAANDHAFVSKLLGTPACCAAFHHEQWVVHGVSDLTWPTSVRSAGADDAATDGAIDVHAPAATNLLWRGVGVRPVFHLPCSAHCEPTQSGAAGLRDLAIALGHAQEMAWLEEILSWPVAWSALHGIAEILTPIGKISMNTDPVLDRHLVRRHGPRLPDEMVRGLAFPYDLASSGEPSLGVGSAPGSVPVPVTISAGR